jgi:hypothetical protein
MGDRADEAWEKAAACERQAQATSDSKLKAMFLRLRQSWIRVGNDAQFDHDLNANASDWTDRPNPAALASRAGETSKF